MQKREIKAVHSSEMWQQTFVHKLLGLSGSLRARCGAKAARLKSYECSLHCSGHDAHTLSVVTALAVLFCWCPLGPA